MDIICKEMPRAILKRYDIFLFQLSSINISFVTLLQCGIYSGVSLHKEHVIPLYIFKNDGYFVDTFAGI